MTKIIRDASLDWRQVAAVASGADLGLSDSAVARIVAAKALVEAIVAQGIRGYGVNTGVGAFCNVIVDRSRQAELSRNIIMSHACGVGEMLPVAETRAIMAAAINNFAHGYSGIRLVLVETLVALLGANLVPLVPARGSIGYISHMAHIALVLIGEGSARDGEAVISGRAALARLGIEPAALEAKEGLSLVNGSPCVSGLSSVALDRLQRLLEWADAIAAMTFENIGSQPIAFAAAPMRLKPSPGMAETAATLTRMLEGSALLAQAPDRTQDAISLRAIPQVHGAVRECLEATGALLDRELASATDNPSVAGTAESPLVYSQAHPVATGLSMALDGLAIAAAKIAATSERRIDRLVNPLVSGLPAFLARNGGVSTGLMIAQYTALSLVSENRRLAAPASLDGGVSSGLQEDEIPHSSPAALKALRVIENFETVLAIELIAAAQAYEFHDQDLARSPATDRLYRQFRKTVAPYQDDRPLASDIAKAVQFLRTPLAEAFDAR
jgi:histidine ammonia-lyase